MKINSDMNKYESVSKTCNREQMSVLLTTSHGETPSRKSHNSVIVLQISY